MYRGNIYTTDNWQHAWDCLFSNTHLKWSIYFTAEIPELFGVTRSILADLLFRGWQTFSVKGSCFWLCGQQGLHCSYSPVIHYLVQGLLQTAPEPTLPAGFPLNFIYKNRQQARFGPQPVVCQLLFYWKGTHNWITVRPHITDFTVFIVYILLSDHTFN